jgi:hypothetical protein
MSTKKNFIEENALLDVSDEELAQFSGGALVGGLLDGTNQALPVLSPVTQPVTGLLGGSNLHTNTDVQTPVANLGLSTPKGGLLGGLI